MLYDRPASRPNLLSLRSIGFSLAGHLVVFLAFWLAAAFSGLFEKDEKIIPIDLTIVVNKNLDGKDNEPPPLKNPTPEQEPEPEKPKPKPKAKEPEKPKELEKIVTNILVKVDKKEENKPEKPKKTKEQIRKEKEDARKKRLAEIRNSGKVVNKPVKIEVKNAKASGNGRTDRKILSDAEILRLLNAGYKPGTSNQLAANEEQLGYSLIKSACEEKWDEPPWTDTLKPMIMRVWFGAGGRIVNFRLEQSSGDARADQSIKTAVSRVGRIPALPATFIEKHRSSGVQVRFTVKPQ